MAPSEDLLSSPTSAPDQRPARKRPKLTAKRARRQLDRLLRERAKREAKRADPIAWLAEQARMSANHAGRLLAGTAPRQNSLGQDYLSWQRLKRHLTTEEIKMVERSAGQ